MSVTEDLPAVAFKGYQEVASLLVADRAMGDAGMVVASGEGTRMLRTVKLQLLCDHIVGLADTLFRITCFGY
ncbi:hypothetical protein [Streptomyces turgidiscabies]|uniref:hypothetical protein n=1 Tax=Streptomyces turgidiscabies TaxID=85558 RepID=UPI0027D81CEE|nr:hypothetical protein [Streptomyces turgidiscabies]